eukprot:CAMPEP_0174579002 /NCGR_PEP_ID=MMETSP0929-20130131/1283_1 /TAXON_ID=548131 ORGANISM="Ostreococcus mediterraneus, Strain clade-D-RCC2572" /NCGR_SAMPLE_ID=MMETSP0929 /ASSEMBLY_ACC=CAM_ASM_000573 /LENGTH=469 /DNA_ID=CAMNT_0015760283 /DNA_START=390 /DNA_END=1799 /DNA_ORIENTATION=-
MWNCIHAGLKARKSDVNVSLECGYPGITRADCVSAGCVYFDIGACRTKTAPKRDQFLSCKLSRYERIPLPGPITRSECLDASACFDRRGCFFPTSALHVSSDDEQHSHTEITPLFSIIVTCYKDDVKFLALSLDSIVRQSWSNWEAIIVDDGSPRQECVQAANSFIAKHGYGPSKMRAFYKTNGFVADARNFGIANSSGKYVLPVDADDFLYPNFLRSAALGISETPDVELLYADQIYFGEIYFGAKTGAHRWHLWETITLNNALKRGPLPVTTIYTRDMWNRVGGYKLDMIFGNEDYSFWLDILKLQPKARKLHGISSWYRLKENAMHADKEYVRMALPMLHFEHSEFYDHGRVTRDVATVFCYLSRTHNARLQAAINMQPWACAGWLWLSLLKIDLWEKRSEVLDTLKEGAAICDNKNQLEYFSTLISWLNATSEFDTVVSARDQCLIDNAGCSQCEKTFRESVFFK